MPKLTIYVDALEKSKGPPIVLENPLKTEVECVPKRDPLWGDANSR